MKQKYSGLIGLTAMFAVSVISCTDNELDYGSQPDYLQSRAAIEVTTPGGLIQQADGTWKSVNCRVPIVGPGRVVNEINTSTVNVIGSGQNGLGNIVDTDITNVSTIPAGISAGVGVTPIVSVKDIYHVYSAGQKVGFVYKDTDNGGATLLTLDLLKRLTLETYLNGAKQEAVYAADDKNTLKLDLLSFNTGSKVSDRVLSFDATKPFDEVRMSFTGVDATAVSSIALAIKYAFVGENPEIRATSENIFSSYWTGGTPVINKGTLLSPMTNVGSAENLVDSDIDNSATFTSELGMVSKATINFKRIIPVGTEIGFYYKTGKVLGLGLFGKSAPTLKSFDSGNNKQEESTPPASLLSLSLIGKSNQTFTNMVTTKECSQIQFQHPRELLDVGGMSVFYAYIREGVSLDPVNYFTFGDAITYNYAHKLPEAETGSVQYVILSQPYGTDPKIENGKIIGMTKDGAYRVQAFYTAPDGRQLSHIATIQHKSITATTGCNKYITATSNGAYATEAIGSDMCLLCLFNGSNNLNNVVDSDVDNYASVGQLASVLTWSPIAAFAMNTPIYPVSGKTRTGFVVQANSNLLDLSALSHFKIRLYDGGTLVSDETADDKTSVKLGVLGFDQSKVRLCIETDKKFDRIELWRKGVADVLTSMRIYNIFFEPASCDEAAEGGGCMELLTNLKDNLQIDYDNTRIAQGLLSAGASFKDLDYILDSSVQTGASLSSIATAGGNTVALKFNNQKGFQSVGIILSGLKDLADVNLTSVGVLKVFNNDKEVANTTNVDILGVDVLTEGGRTYIEVTPEEDFNRIEFTMAGVQLLSDTKICGVYIRPDSDGDGIPDCADTDDDGDKLEINGKDFHTCYGNPLNIPVTGDAVPQTVYVYCFNQDTNENITCNGKISGGQLTIPAMSIPIGRYTLFIYSDESLLAYDVEATVHPQTTTWKVSAGSTDWNDWDNWVNGSPWRCTDVILPSNAGLYPEITAGDRNYCKNIHFESGAELVGTQYLEMSGKAFVDMALQGGRYYLLSAPLQETFTGDMFISHSAMWGKDKYFTPLSASNYAESRNRPIVYQHFWNGTAIEKDDNLNGTDVGTAQWSTDFNAVNTKYAVGQGFLLRAGGSEDRNNYTFRFPKEHSNYSYFRSDGTSTGKSEAIVRNTANIGKFAMSLPTNVTINNKKRGRTFLMGNPFMSHIDVARLISANPSISQIRICKGISYDPRKDIESQTVSSNVDSRLLIAPMEAFFIILKEDATSLKINLTADMLVQKRHSTKSRKR